MTWRDSAPSVPSGRARTKPAFTHRSAITGSSLEAAAVVAVSRSRAIPVYERLPHAPRLAGFTTSGIHASVARIAK